MNRFLIVKTSALGDVVHSFPVVRYLKEKFPTAKIDWIVEEMAQDLVKANPDINKTLCIRTQYWRKTFAHSSTWKEINAFRKELQAEEYDVIFDLQGNTKSAFFTFLAKGKAKVGFGRKTIHEWPNLLVTNYRYDPPTNANVRTENLFLVQQFFKDSLPWNISPTHLTISQAYQDHLLQILSHPALKHRKKVMVCPGAAWPNKQMSESALIDFLKLLSEEQATAFLFTWGAEKEHQFAKKMQLSFEEHSIIVPKLPLSVLQNLMAQVDLVIAMDSLPLHLAGTTQTPTFGVFGASSANKYRPLGDQHSFIQGPCPYGRVFERRCPILRTCPTGLCIKGLSGLSCKEQAAKLK